MIDKNKFEKAQKAVLKKYPEAKLMCDWGGKFFIATKEGKDICNLQISQSIDKYNFDQTEGGEFGVDSFNATLNKIPTIPHANAIDQAWFQAEVAIRSNHIVNRYNGKFIDENIMKKILQDE